jgi:hypothetical protein
MIDPARHAPLRPLPWSAAQAEAAIAEIVADAIAHFDPERFWPVHPQDAEALESETSLYFGAAGMVWALDYLARVGASPSRLDFRPMLPSLLAANKREFSSRGYAEHGSLLFGDMGTAIVAIRIAPSAELANFVYARAEANTALPIRELMWGLPGSMLACVQMDDMTGEERWQSLFQEQAARLLAGIEETENGPLWTQDLYGSRKRYLGPVHGFAGNMVPLMKGWRWLTAEQRERIADVVPRTLAANAWHCETGVTWMPAAGDKGKYSYSLCQHCHGAPGIVTAFADALFISPELETLLLQGGEFTWAGGALAKGSNLCHGTGGNGYPFLKLYRRTKNPLWLERARGFAMTAIAQCNEARQQFGCGRYSLWTGDIGLAVYLWDCLTLEPRFPTIDVM